MKVTDQSCEVYDMREDVSNFYRRIFEIVDASGLTTEKIILSKNSIKSLDNNISEFFKPTTGIITYTLSAKDMIFVNKSDISTMFGMDLELEYDDFIGNSADILQKIDKLKLHIASTSVENGLSGGYLSNPTITKEDIILNSSENKNCTKDKESCSSSVFFAVYTKISELGRLFK